MDKASVDKLAKTIERALTDSMWPENTARTTPQQGVAALKQLLEELERRES